MFYYTLVQHYPERLPKTWEEFERLLIQRFSSRGPVETLHKLMQIRFKDSVSDVTDQFAHICAEGEPLPQERLVQVYLSRFPRSMIKEAMKENFATWVEASEYLQHNDRTTKLKMAEWYQLAPPEFKREVEANPKCIREGWMPKSATNSTSRPFAPRRPGQGGKGPEASRGTTTTARNSAAIENKKFSEFREALVCHQCQGKGHRAKECPSRDLATRRDGSRCRKCGGLGHWARACPSPSPQWAQRGETQQRQQTAPEPAAGQQGNGQA